ncbi:ATP-binding protein [Desulfobacula sp.]|uniref:ATP-binding protein n=1 Tax=Desulfobacula sp. TaxID=2593537 RepID=UPI001EC741F1|nr:ATP-binding protein [Desulfobacula sp.]
MKKQVSIPFDYFFRMALKDYYNWESALVREFIQNSVDADAKNIELSFNGEWLEIIDDGVGMSLTTIETALLTLGGSYKKGSSVGGIGKAKEILYFAWPQWEIRSQNSLIIGSGANYEIKRCGFELGTISKIFINGKTRNLEDKIKRYIGLCNFKSRDIIVKYNGEPVESDLLQPGKEAFVIDGLGSLYLTDDQRFEFKNMIIVQAHGLFMFSLHSVLDKCYVFNISMSSYDCLTSNRDSFIGEWQDKFTKMVGKVAIDSESTCLRKESIIQVKTLETDSNYANAFTRELNKENLESVKLFAGLINKDITEITPDDVAKMLGGKFLVQESIIDKANERRIRSAMKSAESIYYTKKFDECLTWYRNHFNAGFIIVTDMKINSELTHLLHDHETMKLAWLWKEVLDEVAQSNGISERYGYGLLMSKDLSRRAEYRCGYISFNPLPYFEMSWEESVFDMIFSAAEELTHLLGYEYHNESFKNAYTTMLTKALVNRASVNDLVRLKSKAVKADLNGNCIKEEVIRN